MKKIVLYSFLTIISIVLIQACGPSNKEKQAQRTARQNQIAQARQDSVAKAQAEAEAKKKEAELEKKQKAQTTKKPAKMNPSKPAKSKPQMASAEIKYVKGGNYSVQVGSWRSDSVANKRLGIWKKRGYQHAYIVKYGKEGTGNIWFRVRLGVVANKQMAKELQKSIKDKYNASSWISYVGNEHSGKTSK